MESQIALCFLFAHVVFRMHGMFPWLFCLGVGGFLFMFFGCGFGGGGGFGGFWGFLVLFNCC